MTDQHGSLEEWLVSLPPVLDRLAWFVPADFHPDFSTDSLDVVEAALTEQVTTEDTGLVDSAMAYVGEALLRVAGGRWEWDDAAGLPTLRFDEALGLPELLPLQVLIDARKTANGVELRKAHESLQRAVAEYQASHPGWVPAKPGEAAQLPREQWLTDWLERRERAFATWADAIGGVAAWDFTADSIDRLAELTLRRFAIVDEFGAPEQAEFVDGARWYLGEVARRGASGVSWQYQPVPEGYADARDYYAQTGDAWVGSPYLLGSDSSMADPRSLLKVAVIRREPGSVRAGLATLAGAE